MSESLYPHRRTVPTATCIIDKWKYKTQPPITKAKRGNPPRTAHHKPHASPSIPKVVRFNPPGTAFHKDNPYLADARAERCNFIRKVMYRYTGGHLAPSWSKSVRYRTENQRGNSVDYSGKSKRYHRTYNAYGKHNLTQCTELLIRIAPLEGGNTSNRRRLPKCTIRSYNMNDENSGTHPEEDG